MATEKRRIEWLKALQVLCVIFLLPTILFYYLGSYSPVLLKVSYYFIVSLFVFQAFLSYCYSLSALSVSGLCYLPVSGHKPLPKTTFIISAYLPNEIDVVENTILNILKNVERPKDGIEVILAYNTDRMDLVELRLRKMALDNPELVLSNAYNSKSKSENLNYSLDIASGEMIVLLDADHHVAPDCLQLAWCQLEGGKYDVVQGRCKIRNGNRGPVAALVEVEFEAIYGISHFAKTKLFDSALFGGTNGYWRADVIRELKFRTDRLTEDIDVTLRATLAGKRIVHDRNIISSELAPETIAGLWYQRKRWAQGWFQCSWRYQLPILFSPQLNVFKKFMWTTLLMWRIVYDVLSHFLLPIVIAYWLGKGRFLLPVDGYIIFSIFFTMFSGPFEALVAFKNASMPRAPIWRYFYYAFLAFWYTLLKNFIQLVAIRDELLNERVWNVTRRGEA